MRLLPVCRWLAVGIVVVSGCAVLAPGELRNPAKSAQAYGRANPVVAPLPDGTILCEAEEFQVQTPGWEAKNWGTNYYAATFANTFLSRKAYLGAPEQCDDTVATREAEVPEAGRYLALVRYEAAYRFETQFRLRIEQGGKVLLDRLYGARDNVKIWAFPWSFGHELQKEFAWRWGAVENVVWEGHDAYVDLHPGTVKLTLIAGRQQGNAARRNVDLVMLTTDEEQIKYRMANEGHLPLDGMLTQAGDVYIKLHNLPDGVKMTLNVPPGVEDSGDHIRNWTPRTLEADPGQSTDWVEVGSLLDSLCDGGQSLPQPPWPISAKPVEEGGALHYKVEFGLKAADGGVESVRTFESRSDRVEPAYDANIRYTRRIRPETEDFYTLVDYLKTHPERGTPPKRTFIFCYTFDEYRNRTDDPKHMAALSDFIGIMGLTGMMRDKPGTPVKPPIRTGYIDVRGKPPEKLEELLKRLQAEGAASIHAWPTSPPESSECELRSASKAEDIVVVSLGDEIDLASPPADDHAGFRDWLRGKGLEPSDVDPSAGESWENVMYCPQDETAEAKPELYYYSQRYLHHYGIHAQKALTDVIRRYLPNAGIGANYSPHGVRYVGEVHKWVTMFREGGMTMPWSEDYIWQLPMGTQQMNFILLDLFRAGIRGQPDAKILFYVMPHYPGNTPRSWRRQFYGDVAHGMKHIDLFAFRPLETVYSENHSNVAEIGLEVRRAFYELGLFEDVMQDGSVEPGVAALWFSETSDIWNDRRPPFDTAKRALYIAILHQQLPLDFVVEEDALAGDLKDYKVLYLTDAHVSLPASKAIADWVAQGGVLFATAGAGMFDEFNRPNEVMRELLGVEQTALEEKGEMKFIKQDMPFAEPMDTVTWLEPTGAVQMPVIAARGSIEARGADVQGTFSDGSPAITVKRTGSGQAICCAFLPGLSYFKPAIPLRPVDRGATDDAMSHFVPTEFHAGAAALIGAPASGVERPVLCSEPLVETRIIRSEHGVLIPLVNWSAGPVKGLTVTVSVDVPTADVTLASGKPVRVSTAEDGRCVFRLDLDVADALILR